mmetsp:Transcript_3515/g.9863  ORF Transcript_3515/g.9863 Transcript_3515/m.9863 type:complete len:107 (-) Transcript_3515:290-610(-)
MWGMAFVIWNVMSLPLDFLLFPKNEASLLPYRPVLDNGYWIMDNVYWIGRLPPHHSFSEKLLTKETKLFGSMDIHLCRLECLDLDLDRKRYNVGAQRFPEPSDDRR